LQALILQYFWQALFWLSGLLFDRAGGRRGLTQLVENVLIEKCLITKNR